MASSSLGVPTVVSGNDFAPPPLLPHWIQTPTEKSVCLVTLAARPDSSSTGIFCKVGPDLAVITSRLQVQSESTACFAVAEFFFTGASQPQHTSKLNPHVLHANFSVTPPSGEGRRRGRRRGGGGAGRGGEGTDYDMVAIGLPRGGRPRFEDRMRKGVMHELTPMELSTDWEE